MIDFATVARKCKLPRSSKQNPRESPEGTYERLWSRRKKDGNPMNVGDLDEKAKIFFSFNESLAMLEP
jgi:hypothetical protein